MGAAEHAFAESVKARNPRAHVAHDPQEVAQIDVLVADDLRRLFVDGEPSADLARTGVVTAAIPAGVSDPASLLSAITSQGFEVLHLCAAEAPQPFFDDSEQDLVATWRAGSLPAATASKTLIVVAARDPQPAQFLLSMFSFAPNFMDIRTRLPAEALRTQPDLRVRHLRPPGQLPRTAVETPKILLLQRPAPPENVQHWRDSILTHARNGWLTIVEFDDHPELTARVKGRVLEQADWVRFSWAHAVQTSTAQLHSTLAAHNPETRVFQNAVFRLERFPEHLPKRVFYGAISRGPYAAQVAGALQPAIAVFPGVEFVVVGDRAVFEALPTSRKRYHELVPYDEYLKLMGSCSVSLSPIEPGELNAAKSDAKFLDAAARGVLTIASPTIYGDVIRHGETGFIAADVNDWGPLLTAALQDDAARTRMARNAWDYVREHRMFAYQIQSRDDWYRDLWARRVELNAALVARMGL